VNRFSWLALGAGVYVAFTLSLFPAATAYRWFAPDSLSLAGIQGTIWSGRAELGSVGALPLHDLQWEVRALPLLIGRLSTQFQARLADGLVSAALAATAGRVRFSELRASTSLPALRGVLPVQGMEGLASVSLSKLQLERGWPTDMAGELRLAQLEVEPLAPTGQPGLIPLGDYEVVFTETGGQGLAASFRDTGGPLEVSGTLVVSVAREYTLDGLVKTRSDAPDALVQGLAIMTSEPDASGRRRLTLTGTL